MTDTIFISTSEKVEFVDITDQINQILVKNKVDNGLGTVLVKHTTAAVMIGEAEEDLFADLERLINLIPKGGFAHSHGDLGHTPAHILSSIIGQSVTIPVVAGKLDLGTWQRVLLVELHGPRQREISIVATS